MSQGNDFANYASSVEDRSAASEDVWFVAVSSDDIKQMSVDQLDEAFRLGVINAQTAVWTEGMQAWAPLGEVADLDSDGDNAAEPEPAAPFVASAPADSADNLPSTRRTNPGWHNPFEAPQAEGSSVQNGARDSLQSSSPSYSMGPSSFAPVTASYAPSTGSSLNQSTGPVALNVDEDMPPVSRGRRFRPERWLLAAAGIAAVVVVAFNNKDLFSSASSTVAAAEKQTAAAALVARPYDLGSDKGSSERGEAVAKREPVAAAKSADDDKDAPIGSLKGEAGEEEAPTEEAAPAVAAKSGSGASKEAAASKEALRGGFAKAFSKDASAPKPGKAAKQAKQAKLVRKAPPRAASKAKKPGVARAASAFDPLNGSLP